MLDLLFSTTIGQVPTIQGVLLVLGSSLVLGLIISIGYMINNKEDGYSTAFVVSLLVLPMAISIIIMMVGSNIAKAFSMAGAFALVRFRSAPGNPKDITYICITMATGLACGVGYIGYGAVFALIVTLVLILAAKLHFAYPRNTAMILKITIPEDLNFDGAFDDIFKKYAASYKLKKVNTSEFGSLFQLIFKVEVKRGISQKEFIDELRTRNGNLNISLSLQEYDEKVFA